jgi:hypothetical protein
VGRLALVTGLFAGCGPREPALVNPGMSSVGPSVERPTPKTADASAKWEAMSEVPTLHRVGPLFASRGHFAGRWKAETRMNATAETAYAALRSSNRFPSGSMLVELHRGPSSNGPIFAMVKRDPGFYPEGGDWEFVVTDADGWIEDRGALALCARCHAEAATDSVFPLPSDAAK